MEDKNTPPSIPKPADGRDRANMLWEQVKMGWAMLVGSALHDVQPGRAREDPPAPQGDEPRIEKEGYAEEAIPWLDAVYRFSLRLTNGDRDAADDLVQVTFLRAHRFWHTFERGTNVKSWLFTICRNAHLHQQRSARSRMEQPDADFEDPIVETLSASALRPPAFDPSHQFFHDLIEEDVIVAIEELPQEFREVLVLSDMGDLTYKEIAEVLSIPLGTTKSRLFRARRILQERLRDYAMETGHIREEAR